MEIEFSVECIISLSFAIRSARTTPVSAMLVVKKGTVCIIPLSLVVVDPLLPFLSFLLSWVLKTEPITWDWRDLFYYWVRHYQQRTVWDKTSPSSLLSTLKIATRQDVGTVSKIRCFKLWAGLHPGSWDNKLHWIDHPRNAAPRQKGRKGFLKDFWEAGDGSTVNQPPEPSIIYVPFLVISHKYLTYRQLQIF